MDRFNNIFCTQGDQEINRRWRKVLGAMIWKVTRYLRNFRKMTRKTMRRTTYLSMRALDSPSTITLYCDMSSGQLGGSDLEWCKY